MSRRKKKNGHMIDMSARLRVEVFSATEEENNCFELELREIEISVEQRMRLYEEELKKMLIDAMNDDVIAITEKDSLYFIEKYADYIKNRNRNNIRNRLEQYQLFLEKREEAGGNDW